MHKTSAPTITVLYPFHPLAGQTLRCLRTKEGPPATHLVQLGERRLLIPVWMTANDARELALVEHPQLSIAALKGVAAILAASLTPDSSRQSAVADDVRHDPTNTAAILGPTTSTSGPAARGVGGTARRPRRAPAAGHGRRSQGGTA